MSGTQAIGGYTPYNSANYDYSTMLMNQAAQAQAQTTAAAAQAQSFAAAPQADTYVSSAGLQSAEPAKKSKKGLWITAGILATGAAAAIMVAKRGNGANVGEKLKTGWQSIRKDGLFAKKAAEAASEAAESGGEKALSAVEMIQKGGKTTLRMPENTQKLTGKNIVAEAADLGLDKINIGLKDASEVKGMNFVLEDGGIKHLITWNNKTGKVNCRALVKDVAKRENVDLSTMSEEFQKAVNESIEAIKNKDLKGVNKHVKIKNIVYEGAVADGTVGTYLYQGKAAKKTGTSVRRIVTDRFGADSDVVAAAMKNDEKFARAVEGATAAKPGLGGVRRAKYDNWGVRSATHTPTVDGWPANAKIVIENDEIVGVLEGGEMVDKVRFDALQYRYPDAFKHVMKKDLDDVVRFYKK